MFGNNGECAPDSKNL
ncbi:hypothetical protein A2U01_0053584, partial [Trifolium medium]|nr:hypothetical protein [Trifolium medium]